ncbi:anaerobic ribonucleoside-triphosphate reductase activating protein [Desulfosarcina widdelii]|uniref:Anaerobic ribonucleoside-triphosphate reductase activating protein n=1 Tax=Desulfosarcina widdelii TaxID=947919 RepID=A0A5K7Z536_9BACT|nr:anaerobic ribonucleoside-triphosphate reductase activating protein [Desulfosarcina widdelii]BBO75033.1 anaerobic ribonucleoside-triphosphate reductase activating protein [Desulfosarcina widdelii]
MLMAGLQKNSFIDYPGKISCVLFTTGCNFVCPYCHNADLARGEYPQRLGLDEITAFLRSRRGMLEGVVITGGEPTLHDWVVDLCKAIKSLNYPVKLDTNGSRPDVLDRLFQKELIDFVAMDIKAPLEVYGPFCRTPRIHETLTESIQLIMGSAPDYEFRTTCAAPFATRETIEAIARTIEGARCYVLQRFNRRAACLDPEFNRRQDPTIYEDEMKRFQTLAKPFVQRCIIR